MALRGELRMDDFIDTPHLAFNPDTLVETLYSGSAPAGQIDAARRYFCSRRPAFHPQWGCRRMPVEQLEGDAFYLHGHGFESPQLSSLLSPGEVVWPYLVTACKDPACREPEGVLEAFWESQLEEELLALTLRELLRFLRAGNGLSRPSEVTVFGFQVFNPGTGVLPGWGIEQQRPLFALLGSIPDELGVELSGSFQMEPIASMSGLIIAAKTPADNCRSCTRLSCPRRGLPGLRCF